MDKLLLRLREAGGGSPSPVRPPGSGAIKKHNLSNYAKVIGGEVSNPRKSVF